MNVCDEDDDKIEAVVYKFCGVRDCHADQVGLCGNPHLQRPQHHDAHYVAKETEEADDWTEK